MFYFIHIAIVLRLGPAAPAAGVDDWVSVPSSPTLSWNVGGTLTGGPPGGEHPVSGTRYGHNYQEEEVSCTTTVTPSTYSW